MQGVFPSYYHLVQIPAETPEEKLFNLQLGHSTGKHIWTYVGTHTQYNREHMKSDRVRGWGSLARAVDKVRLGFEKSTGKQVFLIADERDRAAELAFYLPDKRVEGPGHPAVYIPESQDMVNQFSFWPRYDEFVELKPGTPRPEVISRTRATKSSLR